MNPGVRVYHIGDIIVRGPVVSARVVAAVIRGDSSDGTILEGGASMVAGDTF